MPNVLARIDSKVADSVAFVIGVLVAGLSCFQGDSMLGDPFHQGEHFAAAVSYLAGSGARFHPLAIHGVLDVFPALLAERLTGAGNYFLATEVIYCALNFAAAIALLAIAWELLRSKPNRWLLLLVVGLVAPFVVGYRDLLLLTSLYLFVMISGRNAAGPSGVLLKFGLGIAAAFGVFWSFDRGIAGTVALGAGVLTMLPRGRTHAIPLVAFVATITVLALCFDAFSLSNYLSNVRLLMDTSSQWRYVGQQSALELSTFALALNSVALTLFVLESWRSGSFERRVPQVLAFVLLALVLVKIGTNRADILHVYWALWVPMLAALAFYGGTLKVRMAAVILVAVVLIAAIGVARSYDDYAMLLVVALLGYATVSLLRLRHFQIVTAGLMVLIACGLWSVAASSTNWLTGGRYAWIGRVLHSPANEEVSPPPVVWVAERLREQGVNCVFDLTNSGLINGLVRRPSCSRFTYPVYATTKYEQQLIDDLRAASPRALVYSSGNWSYRIDGKPMNERFQALDRFILTNYPVEACSVGYCVRYARN